VKNTYEIQVRAQCPVNSSDTDLYDFTICSHNMIEVEKIAEFFQKNIGKKIFQEVLTQQCAVTIGARVISVGWHSGIKVICEAP
jgi:hypothetical protein